jgi:hypothetical protein
MTVYLFHVYSYGQPGCFCLACFITTSGDSATKELEIDLNGSLSFSIVVKAGY